MKWKLVNPSKRHEIGGLSAAEAAGFLAGFQEGERSEWLVWRPGMAEWVCASSCPELPVSPSTPVWSFHASQVARPAPSRREPRGERRAHERFDIKLRVIMICGSRSFRAYTRNVSDGGLMLDRKVPWGMMNQNCLVYLHNEGEGGLGIEFRAKIVGSAENPLRFSFVDADAASLARLQDWIAKSFASGEAA